MTAELVKVETSQVATHEGLFAESLIDRFVKFAGVSVNSCRTYTKSIRQLFKYFSANAITAPTRENLVDWVNCMKAEEKSPSTVQLYLSAAKIFFRWLEQEKIYVNIADHLKSGLKPSRKHKKDALTTEQCKNLVNSVKNLSAKKKKSNETTELRDRAILSLMTTAGLRTVEVVRANVGDIRFERGKMFLYVQGKGHSEADEKILLAKQAYAAIQRYLKVRGKVQSTEPLFVSASNRNSGKRLDTQTISRMVKRNLRGMGLDLPTLTAHSLRHSVATNLVFARVELPKIQMILRHRNLATTMIYADAWKRYNNDGEQFLADEIFGAMKE